MYNIAYPMDKSQAFWVALFAQSVNGLNLGPSTNKQATLSDKSYGIVIIYITAINHCMCVCVYTADTWQG